MHSFRDILVWLVTYINLNLNLSHHEHKVHSILSAYIPVLKPVLKHLL